MKMKLFVFVLFMATITMNLAFDSKGNFSLFNDASAATFSTTGTGTGTGAGKFKTSHGDCFEKDRNGNWVVVAQSTYCTEGTDKDCTPKNCPTTGSSSF